MAFLEASSVRTSLLSNAPKLSLLLPVTPYDATVLVGDGDEPTAILLDTAHIWSTMPAAAGANYRGLLVEGIRIELDMDTVIDADSSEVALGMMVRRGDSMYLMASGHTRGFNRNDYFLIQGGLPVADWPKVGFKNWRIVVGQKETLRVLWTSPKPAPSMHIV